MAESNDVKQAREYLELVGPFVKMIGRRSSNQDVEAVGSMLSKLPVSALVAFFAKMRTDLVEIDVGTMRIDDGVEIVIEDG